MKFLSLFFLLFLPKKIKPLYCNKILKWNVHETALIGFAYLDIGYLELGEGSIIKSLTIFRNMDKVIVGDFSRIGTLNWISGARSNNEGNSILKLGIHSAITNRHYIDCTNVFSIGNFSTFAGVKSTVMTHSINVYASVQGSNKIVVGDFCFIGTCTTLLGGAVIPDFCIIGACALVTGELKNTHSLYGGVPATKIKSLGTDLAYFNRKYGSVS